MKIVIMDGHAVNPGDMSWDAFQQFGEVTVYERTKPEEVEERAKDADCVFTNKVTFDAAVMDRLPKLKYIGVLATAYNVVDIKAAAERGITVTNIPAYSTDSVAQHVFALLLNVINRVDKYARDSRDGVWSRNPDFCYWDGPMHELSQLTIGIVGLGNIGKKVAQIAAAFGMQIYAYTSKAVNELPDTIRKSTMEGLFNRCDIITLHCPLTPDTKEIINRDTLAKMKPNAILVNTGRGPLVNEADVADALQRGIISAYCADVMTQEPPSADNPLLKCPNAFLTPHLAWGTYEARQRLMQIQIENMKAFAAGKPINVIR